MRGGTSTGALARSGTGVYSCVPVETNITAGRSLAVPSEMDAASSITNPWKYRPSGMRTTKTSPVLGAFRLGLEHLQVHRVRLDFASPSAMRSPR